MTINATSAGKTSPFDLYDLIRVRYKTDGRKIEGDFKAYRKTFADQEWKLDWVEKDFNYEWYCWVEWEYPGGEWKVEFIDRIAGVTEEVIFRVGTFGEDICYKGVIIHQYGFFSLVRKDGKTITEIKLEDAKKIIDYNPHLFNVQCGEGICTEIGKQVVLDTCPDGTAKRWKTCLPFGYKDKDVVEVYRGAAIFKKVTWGVPRYHFEYFHGIGKGGYSSNSLAGAKAGVDTKILGGCTFYTFGEWIEDEQECPICTEGQTRNESYCPDGVTKKSWEECVSGAWVVKIQTCPVTCTEGTKRNVVLCPDGEFMRSWEECVSGTWVAKTGVCGCAAGTASCQGYNLYTCVDGEWVLRERNSAECGYTENGKINILDPIISWIETSFDVDRKTAEMYAYLGIAGVGAVVVLGVMSK